MRRGILSIAALLTMAGAVACGTGSEPAGEPMERYTGQRLDWKGCDDAVLDEAGAQCADVTVPVNYAEPQGKTMTVAISRMPSTDPAQRRGIMMGNPGGPGGPGLDQMIELSKAMTPDVRARYDLIGMDPRGIGRSSAVNCHWPTGFGLRSGGNTAESYAKNVAVQSDLAARCVDAEGDRLVRINTRDTARDMDLIRGLLGENRINYFGTSYGTYLGAVYAQMFPERTDRFVLDSAVDPYRYGPVGMVQDMGPANEAAFEQWAAFTAARDAEYRLGATPEAVRATVTALIQRAGDHPIRYGSFDLDDQILPMVLFTKIDDPRKYADLATSMRQIADAADGVTVEPTPATDAALKVLLHADPADISPQMAVMCGDAGAPRDTAWYWSNIEAARPAQPIFGALANNITPCAFWPAPAESPTVIDNSVPMLIVQATGDTRTTYGAAQAMHRALKGSRMVTLDNVAVHSIYGNYPNKCAEAAVNTYFRDGTLPATDLTCQDDK
ncbi:alpha/beta hydrolase [Nocardia yamanashiensis]|uniref:alpha/beta hydrolase n=1 Tax=Nocardia yamanashiensis TaxID=209247 RepID=UPI001E3401D8|nr:alpha/beta hydrolase [Nocardia yamanashiensis]UGT40328.1 alpha/beta hydrolase [Nocardia yamanashiensis]